MNEQIDMIYKLVSILDSGQITIDTHKQALRTILKDLLDNVRNQTFNSDTGYSIEVDAIEGAIYKHTTTGGK